jgi:hypothetical protein
VQWLEGRSRLERDRRRGRRHTSIDRIETAFRDWGARRRLRPRVGSVRSSLRPARTGGRGTRQGLLPGPSSGVADRCCRRFVQTSSDRACPAGPPLGRTRRPSRSSQNF